MASGKTHEKITKNLFPVAAFYLGYIHADYKLAIIFWLLWMIGTYLINCDNDHPKSRSTKRLGLIGKITSTIFTHRRTLHSFLFWSVIGAVGYYFTGWVFMGLVIPQYLHILTDKVT